VAPITFILPMRFAELELLQRRRIAQPAIEAIAISPIADAALEDVICKPLQAAGYEIEEALVAALLFDLKDFDAAEAPVRLSCVLRKLCETCADDKLLRLDVYASWAQPPNRGNPLDCLIAGIAEAAFDRAEPIAGESAAWRKALSDCLIVLDSHKAPVRRLSRLYGVIGKAERIAIEMLAVGILSRHSTDEGEYVEIASHILFKAWPRLRCSVDALSEEPFLAVSHKEIASNPEPAGREGARRFEKAYRASKRHPFKMTAMTAAVAGLALLGSMVSGTALLSKSETANDHGHAASLFAAETQTLSMFAGAWPAWLTAGAGRDGKASLAIWRRAQRLADRRKLSRQRQARMFAETLSSEPCRISRTSGKRRPHSKIG
jgi:hypothetical protein